MKPFLRIRTQLINLEQVRSVELNFGDGGDGVCFGFGEDYYISFWREDAEALRRFFASCDFVREVSVTSSWGVETDGPAEMDGGSP